MTKKSLIKVLISLALIVCMLVSVFVPAIGVLAENMNSAASTMSFPAPVFKDSPGYTYEIMKPSANIDLSGFETFAPAMVSNVQSGAPIISGVTDMAGPNDSVSIEGQGFTGGTVWMYGLDKEGNGMFTVCETTYATDTTVNAIISEKYQYGVYLFWVESASGVLSRPILVNEAESNWISHDAVSPGATVSFYGKNLTTNNDDSDDAVSYIYLTNGTKSYEAEVIEANPYKVQFTVPAGLADGEYKVWAHNGHGGQYGWSDALPLTIKNGVENLWTGKTITVSTVTELRNAITNASDRDTIFLKNGTYIIDNQVTSHGVGIRVTKELRFVGESRDGVKIVSSIRSRTNANAFASGAPCIAVSAFPSEFRNITFEDNVADFDTYGVDNVHSVFLKAWGYDAIRNGDKSNEYFKVEDCNFIVRRLNPIDSPEIGSEIDLELRERYGKYYSNNSASSHPLGIDQIENAYVNNCHFEASVALKSGSSGRVIITNCTARGNAIITGASGAAFCYLESVKHIDLTNNQLHGMDLYTDPDGTLEPLDLGFERVIVIQNNYDSTDDTYIGHNDIRRNGVYDGNSAEVILFETLGTEYVGNVSSVSSDGKTITLPVVWDNIGTEDAPIYGKLTNVKKPIIGATVVVFGGTGEAQYRRIVNVTAENNIVIDRPFDVPLATQNSANPSFVIVSRVNENNVVFRNYIEGPEIWHTTYNSTAAVQAYATMVDYIADRNDVKNLHTGFYCDTHYGVTENDEAYYNGFVDTIILNNKITNVRDGVDVNLNLTKPASLSWADLEWQDIYDGTKAQGSIAHNIMVRNNDITKCRYATEWRVNSNDEPYDAMLGRGATGVAVGQLTHPFQYSTTQLWETDLIKGTVIEHNKIKNTWNANIHIRNAQDNTVIRNNYCDGRGDEEDTILYETPRAEGYPEVQRPYIINNYGNAEEGIYGTVSNLESFDEFKNSDFAEGLKYWASNSGKGYAADNATIVDGAVKVDSKIGITSVDFKPQNIPANSKVAVVYEWKGSENVRVELKGYGLQTVSRDKLTTFANSDVKSGWNRTMNNYTLTTTEDLDLNVVIYSLDGTAAEIDNIEFVVINEEQGYYETADGRKYNLLDGSVYGGTAQKGIVSNNADDIYKYGYTNGLQNASFDDGLKFWQLTGTATSTISANGGKLVFSSAARYNGVISAPFKVKNSNYSGTNNRFAIMLDYTAITTTGSYYTVNLYETVNGTTTKYPLTITAGVTTANTSGFSGAAGTGYWKENAIYNLEITANRNTFKSEINEVRLARYDGSALTYTDMLSGEIYKNNTTAKKLESVATVSNSTVAEELKNGDFSSGNAYWYGTSTVADGKLTPSADVTSLSFRVNAKNGDKLAVMFDYVATANATVTFSGSSTGTRTVSKGTGVGITTAIDYSATNYTVTLGTGATYDNIRVVTVNSDGTYTDTITGESYGSNFAALGGTYEDGYYSDGSYTGSVLSGPKNLDFSEGLRYWTSKHDRSGYASTYATINLDGSITVTAQNNYDGLTTADFKLPNVRNGSKIVVSFEAKGEKAIYLRVFRSAGNTVNVSYTANANKWITAKSSVIEITDTTEVFSLDFQLGTAGTSVAIRNVKVQYVDNGGLNLYHNLDGSPVGYQYGDANVDGRVDLADLVAMKKYLVDNSKKIYLAAANVDKVAYVMVTANDIAYMQNFVLTGKKEF